MIASMWAARGMIARWSLGVLVGCGESGGEPQEPDVEPELALARFDSICGRDGPFRLFAAPEGEAVEHMWFLDTRWKGGRLFSTLACSEDGCGAPLTGLPNAALYWIGPCGEVWQRVDLGASIRVGVPQPIGTALLGCTIDDDLVAIDLDTWGIQTLATGLGCSVVPLGERGLILRRHMEGGRSQLLLLPSSSEPENPVDLDLFVHEEDVLLV